MSGEEYHFGGLAASAPSAPDPETLARLPLNDDGNAQRLIRWVGGRYDEDGELDLAHARLLYLRNRGWIAFNKRTGCWDLEHGESRARIIAIDVARSLYDQMELRCDEYAAWCERQDPKATPNAKRLQAYRDFANSAGNKGRVEAMLATAAAFLEVDLDAFDRDPLLLNVKNGTLRFRVLMGADGKARPAVEFRKGHDPADRCTRVCAVAYDQKAEAPLFEAFLRQVLPSDELRDCVHRIHGYAMTGSTKEQAFFIYQGKGGDGKSTLVGAVREVMGTYGDNCGVETFLDTGIKRGGDASPDIARLAGDTRLISTGEPPANSRLNTGAIKAYTGGAPVLARELRQGIFSFTPLGKVIMECNRRPAVQDSDDGIWRRLLIVPWDVQIPREQQDRDLPQKLRGEQAGILNWLIAGALKWLEPGETGGLTRPQAVVDAIEDYRRGGNPFAQWLKDRVILDKDHRIGASELYTDYKDWMERNGHDKPMSQKSFGAALGDLQIILAGKDASGKQMRRGAKLRPLWDVAGEAGAAEPGPGLGGAAGAGSPEGSEAPPPGGPDDYGQAGSPWAGDFEPEGGA